MTREPDFHTCRDCYWADRRDTAACCSCTVHLDNWRPRKAKDDKHRTEQEEER